MEEPCNKRPAEDVLTDVAESSVKKAKWTKDAVLARVKKDQIAPPAIDVTLSVEPIPKHEHVVITVLNEDGNMDAHIKLSPLSESEAKICDWMRVHPHDDFQCMIQIMFTGFLNLYGKYSEYERRLETVESVEEDIDRYMKDYEKKPTNGDLPFTREQLADIMYDIIDGAENWFHMDNMQIVNRFMTKPGAFCIQMTGWC